MKSSAFRLLWTICCLAGNLFHIYWISSKYFEYQVATNIQLYYPDVIDNPSLLMCFETVKMFAWDNLTVEEKQKLLYTKEGRDILRRDLHPICPHRKKCDSCPYHCKECPDKNLTKLETTVKECITKSIFHLTESEQRDFYVNLINRSIDTRELFRLTRHYFELFKFSTLDPSKKDYDSELVNRGLVKLTEFFKSENKEKCFLFEHQGRFRTQNYNLVRNVYHLKLFSSLFYRLEKGNFDQQGNPNWRWKEIGDIVYSLAPPGRDIFGTTEHSRVEVWSNGRWSMTYSEFRTRLLPPPYSTACRDYEVEGYMTQRGCYMECIRSYSWGIFRKLHPDVWVTYNDTDKQILTHDDTGEDGIINEIDLECAHRCGQKECFTHLYVPRIMVAENLKSARRVYIDQLISMVPVTQCDTIERVVLSQYLTDVSSSLGFWLGLSAIGIGQGLLGLIGRLINTSRITKSNEGRIESNSNLTTGETVQLDVNLHNIKTNSNTIKRIVTAMRQEIDIFKRQNL